MDFNNKIGTICEMILLALIQIDTVKPRKYEHLGTRAKTLTLGGVHISEVFS